MHNKWKNYCIKTVAYILLIVFSLLLGLLLSNPGTYRNTFANIDDKADNVLALTGVTATASTAITLLHEDIGTPIADQLAEFIDYFLIILSILLAEKYLVTVFAFIAFQLAIPLFFASCIPFLDCIIPEMTNIRKFFGKIALLFFVLYLIIPISTLITYKIEDTYQFSFDSAISAVGELGGVTTEEDQPDEEESSGIGALWNKVTDAVSSVADTISDIREKATNAINSLVNALAVMIITSCIVPLVVLFICLWVVKSITGTNNIHIEMPHRRALPPHAGHLHRLKDADEWDDDDDDE